MNAARVVLALAIVSLPATACVIGPKLAVYPPAHGPQGAAVAIRVGRSTITGEAIAVTDSGVVTVHEGQLAFVPWPAIDDLSVNGIRSSYIPARDGPEPSRRARIARLSRFPQGLTPELERRLLAQFGQTEMRVVRR